MEKLKQKIFSNAKLKEAKEVNNNLHNNFKKQLLTGNFVIALLSSFVIIIIWIFEFFAISKDADVIKDMLYVFSDIILPYAVFAFLIVALWFAQLKNNIYAPLNGNANSANLADQTSAAGTTSRETCLPKLSATATARVNSVCS